MASQQKVILFVCPFFFVFIVSCSSQDLKNFGKDIAHNVGCEQQYQYMHRGDALRDQCLSERP